MNQPSEEARYLASWLIDHQEEYIDEEWKITDWEKLAECIQEYFNSRR